MYHFQCYESFFVTECTIYTIAMALCALFYFEGDYSYQTAVIASISFWWVRKENFLLCKLNELQIVVVNVSCSSNTFLFPNIRLGPFYFFLRYFLRKHTIDPVPSAIKLFLILPANIFLTLEKNEICMSLGSLRIITAQTLSRSLSHTHTHSIEYDLRDFICIVIHPKTLGLRWKIYSNFVKESTHLTFRILMYFVKRNLICYACDVFLPSVLCVCLCFRHDRKFRQDWRICHTGCRGINIK